MTRTELDTLLKTLNIPVFYNHTTRNTTINAPYIVYLERNSNNFDADNKVLYESMDYLIVLFTIDRDNAKDSALKTLLNNNQLPYELSDVDFDEDLLLYKLSYVVRL